MKKKSRPPQDPTLKELDLIKRLLILLLIKAGASKGEIAKALKMDQGNFTRAYPIGKVKRFGER
jgi:hypothetical protein